MFSMLLLYLCTYVFFLSVVHLTFTYLSKIHVEGQFQPYVWLQVSVYLATTGATSAILGGDPALVVMVYFPAVFTVCLS